MYESKNKPLAPAHVFVGRVMRSIFFAVFVLSMCLALGIVGYHYTAGLLWIDAIHNASMILSGMGPVAEIKTTGGKLFSSAYALFSGVVFITNIGIILAPMAHRLYHRLHLEDEDGKP